MSWTNESKWEQSCLHKLPISSFKQQQLNILPFHWDHPHICTDGKKIEITNDAIAAKQYSVSCTPTVLLSSENEFVFDLRRTLSDTTFFVLMRLMTSSWIQEEMEYPLMRTISSPTYTSTQDGILGVTPSLSIYKARSQMMLSLLQQFTSVFSEYTSHNMIYWAVWSIFIWMFHPFS